jgi:oxygen-independent coproporphyrinogen-3 oxidase
VVGDKPPIAKFEQVRDAGQKTVENRINGSNSGTIAHYVEVLCQEIRLAPSFGSSLETVFLGGGTPSLLSVEQLNQILETLTRQFGIAANAEISMEIDPATFDLEQVEGYRAAGVNRVSLGVQAFQQELLAASGRSHTVEDIYRAIELVHQAGFQNISLDLISGLPHQTLEHWQASLEQAISLAPTHLSCYDLTVEPGTPFSRQYKPGAYPLPSDDATADMYRLAQRLLTNAGFDHYEVSNYAKLGYQCRHNRVYWKNQPFYGFGMGATSYVGGDRFARPRKTREYYEWVEEVRVRSQESGVRSQELGEEDTGTWRRGDAERHLTTNNQQRTTDPTQNSKLKTQNSLPTLDSRPPTPDLLLDTLMLGLRLAEGLDISELLMQFGRDIFSQIWLCLQPYYQKGWIELRSEPGYSLDGVNTELPEAGRICLTDPEGFLFSNVILVRLFEEFE